MFFAISDSKPVIVTLKSSPVKLGRLFFCERVVETIQNSNLLSFVLAGFLSRRESLGVERENRSPLSALQKTALSLKQSVLFKAGTAR